MKRGCGGLQKFCNILLQAWLVKLVREEIVFSKAGHLLRMCSKSSDTSDATQVLIRQTPFALSDQCLHNLSVLYLPDSILACTEALMTSYSWGDDAAFMKSGWGLVSDMKRGLKYFNDGRTAASLLSFISQYEIIFFLTNALNGALERWFSRKVRGSVGHSRDIALLSG